MNLTGRLHGRPIRAYITLNCSENLMADEPENLVLEMLRAMRGDMIALNEKVDRIATEQRAHSRTLGVLLQEARLLRAAVNDIVKENVTPGEMEAVHDDLTQLRQEVDLLTARLEVVEERQKDH
jgi:ubiquinone biosynthesis protein UbiJ